MILDNYSNLTPCKFFYQPEVKRCLIRFIRSYGGGGGGGGTTPDLQAVSVVGNTTGRGLIVTGYDATQFAALPASMYQIYIPGAGSNVFSIGSGGFGTYADYTLTAQTIVLSPQTKTVTQKKIETVQLEIGGNSTTYPFAVSNQDVDGISASFLGKVKGAPPSESDDFVTLGFSQANSPIDSSAKATATTTDATPITIIAMPTVSGTTYTFQARAVANSGSGAQGASFNMAALVTNNGGVVTIVDTAPLFTPITSGALSATDLSYAVSGTNIILVATGIAATTISWKASITVLSV